MDLLPQLPLARHFLCFFQHHQNMVLSSQGCYRCTITSDEVEMFPRALHPHHSRLISVLLPDPLDKPVLASSCHRHWTIIKCPTLELPLSTLGGYGPAFVLPLTHLPQCPFWVTSFFSSPDSPVITDQLNIFPKYETYSALHKCFPTL